MIDSKQERIFREWRAWINMTPRELARFYDSPAGQDAGLSVAESRRAGIRRGRDSARAILRMHEKLERLREQKRRNQIPRSTHPANLWTAREWDWARAQIAFVKRMSGVPGALREPDGSPTRLLKALKIWGHNPFKPLRSQRGTDATKSR